MSFLSTLALAMGSSWVSGINMYAAVATLGLLGRFGQLKLPGELGVVTSWWVIGVALGLYAIEFVADKVPFVDSLWDAVHTFIRVPAGAVLAAAAFGDFDKVIQTVAFLVGGGIALSSHGTKATTRAAINTSPEPVSNILASLGEDVVGVGAIVLAVSYPIVAITLVVIAVAVSLFLIRRIIRYLARVMGRIRHLGLNE
ncbi:MAG TPA: DUF4126 domain-containing protein [Blastocatellia bacterium]|nr:DUF4126 domain-containing protein [Blastocatellia bacterium]